MSTCSPRLTTYSASQSQLVFNLNRKQQRPGAFRMSEGHVTTEMLRWEKRSAVLAAFGLVGFGALFGAGAVYWLFVRRKIESVFQIHSVLIEDIQKEVDTLKRASQSVLLGEEGATAAAASGGALDYGGSDEDEEYLTPGPSDDEEGEGGGSGQPKRKIESKSRVDGEDETAIFLEKIDQLLDGGSIANQHEAYNILKINKDKLQNSCEFWWRLAKATHMESSAAGSSGNKELKRAHIEAAFAHAEKALKLNESSADAHKWYAITCGSRSDYLSMNERIQSGFTFKEHVDRAVSLNPRDGGCYHLLGRFCLEVSQLSWIERKVAATLFSKPPTATTKEALDNFLESEKIKPFIENRLYMAKTYISMGDNRRAAKWLEAASQLPIQSMSDSNARTEVQQLLQKYRKYLS